MIVVNIDMVWEEAFPCEDVTEWSLAWEEKKQRTSACVAGQANGTGAGGWRWVIGGLVTMRSHGLVGMDVVLPSSTVSTSAPRQQAVLDDDYHGQVKDEAVRCASACSV